MECHERFVMELLEFLLYFVIFSGQDGNPEYLSDLERQIINRNRLRQV